MGQACQKQFFQYGKCVNTPNSTNKGLFESFWILRAGAAAMAKIEQRLRISHPL